MNDPVHGFINIPNQLIYEIIQHRYFQRLRRISQTGLTELVYPGQTFTIPPRLRVHVFDAKSIECLSSAKV